jgi:hypothetical protein
MLFFGFTGIQVSRWFSPDKIFRRWRCFRQTIDDPRDAFLHRFKAKVENQSELELCEHQVSTQLFGMHRVISLGDKSRFSSAPSAPLRGLIRFMPPPSLGLVRCQEPKAALSCAVMSVTMTDSQAQGKNEFGNRPGGWMGCPGFPDQDLVEVFGWPGDARCSVLEIGRLLRPPGPSTPGNPGAPLSIAAALPPDGAQRSARPTSPEGAGRLRPPWAGLPSYGQQPCSCALWRRQTRTGPPPSSHP